MFRYTLFFFMIISNYDMMPFLRLRHHTTIRSTS